MTGRRYTKTETHSVRHFSQYVEQCRKLKTENERTHLKKRLNDVLKLTMDMFFDAYELTFLADGEQKGWDEFIWKSEMEQYADRHKVATEITGSYEYEVLHPMRHLGKYMMELKDQKTNADRRVIIKKRCGDVMSLAVQMNFDAKVLLKEMVD